MKTLKEKWNITSNYQMIIIFIVFAINGSMSAKISSFFMNMFDLSKENLHWTVYYFLILVIVLPIYPFLLIIVGYLFGQFDFFYKFGKKLLVQIGLGFILGK